MTYSSDKASINGVVHLFKLYVNMIKLCFNLRLLWLFIHQKILIASVFIANNRAPSLYINGSLLVPIGGVKPLDPALLSIKDADSQSESMLLQLLQPPNNGHLVILENERKRTLGKDDTFTLTQLKRRAVRFVHDREQTKWVCDRSMTWSQCVLPLLLL